ncbi:DUF4011 domain-containing protein [Kitasatospora sp. NPDC004669]|uniref:DUF4011 domain-containing protein n=1 Tax=Kitasatospora sp. NPDC004669 TaxID=3154555 RepID=UPI0033AFDF63
MEHRRPGSRSGTDPLEGLLDHWQRALIDLGFRNRLVSYRRTRNQAGMDITAPGMSAILDRLTDGCVFAPVKEPEPDAAATQSALPVQLDKPLRQAVALAGSRPIDTPASRAGARRPVQRVELVTSKATQAEQDRHLRRLVTVAKEKFNDYGLWVLHLGVGFLKWRPAPSAESVVSPLVLVPVTLRRWKGDSYLLEINGDEEVTLNPALAIKMEELGVDWPSPEQVDLPDVPALLDQVRRRASKREGWSVDDRVVLDAFNSSKEAMYRDLKENRTRILKSHLVRAIGLGGSSNLPATTFDFDPVPLDRIDQLQPPEQTPLVLDSDSSQRQCVAAAVEGRSFVMDGPPGTGKSQTITNIIAGLLDQGRTVLFVSEKAAALDVVRNRLKDVGLDDYVLALHSNTMGRKQVAQELGRALEAPPRSFPGPRNGERSAVKDLREELSGYAAAMNERRAGLGASLHTVLGRIALLEHVHPLRPEPSFDASGLTEEVLRQITEAAGWIARSWRPAVEGEAFVWRDLSGVRGELEALDRALEKLDGIRRTLAPHAALLRAMGWEGLHDAARLVEALRVSEKRPTLPVAWLGLDFPHLSSTVESFIGRYSHAVEAEQRAVAALGASWVDLASTGSRAEATEWSAPSNLPSSTLDLTVLTADQAMALVAQLATDADALDQACQLSTGAARMYGVPEPVTSEDALRLARLAAFSAVPPTQKPPARWLTPEGLSAARTALSRLSEAIDNLRAARGKAQQVFTDRVLEEESLEEVAQRFATVHQTFAGRFSAGRRTDRRLVRTLLPHQGKCTKHVIAALPSAVAWQKAQQALAQEARLESQALAHLWKGEDTDFDAAADLLVRAEEILDLAPRVTNPEALRGELAHGGSPRTAARTAASQAAEILTRWRDSLVPPPAVGAPYTLEDEPIASAARWSRDQLPPLQAARDVLQTVGSVSGRTHWTLRGALDALKLVSDAVAANEQFEAPAAQDRQFLEDLYRGRATDPSALRAAVVWVAELRKACGLVTGQVFRVESSKPLHAARRDAELEDSVAGWSRASAQLTGLFIAEREQQLQLALTRDLASAEALLAQLDGDRGGPDDWAAYLRGRRVLDARHLGDLVVRAVKAGVERDDFRAVAEKAVLRSWADRVIENDGRLLWTRSQDRDDRVTEFRKVDRILLEHARIQVARACDARRPGVLRDASTRLLNTEGRKKTRHKPVRTLLNEADKAVRLVKPCFMMSPLMVSRLLPPDFMFDVVIFDEASQVLPQDAINCVYRGRALIVAGDEKQLPPTAFFTAGEDEDEDDAVPGEAEDRPTSYESLLTLAKGSGMIKNLSLRWHYRSRHEHLIAFSNHEFYKQSMTTFPGALADSPDVGVAFVRAADGCYQPGAGARNNPLEAREVARRVIHHFDTRSGRSLGVVALSQAQADAIREAVDDARHGRPDLDEHFSEDRLDGFFIKNLETVQGDERDVIIMSVGYGPQQPGGKVSRNFGPMNRAGGWRRLNVAVTRARYRVEVVASFDPDELGETGGESFRYFSRYLKYAKHGPSVLAQELEGEEAPPESPFEESVLEVLQGWGYTVRPQVGVAGYRIDLGVRDPRRPGRYALGIECDGAMYHSSKAARDRDRLRESVLSGLGWNLHRIWGTDWYRNRAGAEARLKEAVERAVGAPEQLHEAFGIPAQQTSDRTGSVPPPTTAGPATAPAIPAPGSPVTSRQELLSGPVGQRIDHELSQIRARLEQRTSTDHRSGPRTRADQVRRERDHHADLEARAALLKAYLTGDRTAPADVVSPGRVVTLCFDDEDGEQEFEITSGKPFDEGTTQLSPFTALGKALAGHSAGTTVTCDENGRRLAVHIRNIRE